MGAAWTAPSVLESKVNKLLLTSSFQKYVDDTNTTLITATKAKNNMDSYIYKRTHLTNKLSNIHKQAIVGTSYGLGSIVTNRLLSKDGTKLYVIGDYYESSNKSFAFYLKIVDLEDINQPLVIGEYKLGGDTTTVDTTMPMVVSNDGTKLYLGYYNTKFSPKVEIIDIKNPKKPSLVGSYEIPYSAVTMDLSVDGTKLYANSTIVNSTYVLNITDPSNPSLVTHGPSPYHRIAFSSDGTKGYMLKDSKFIIMNADSTSDQLGTYEIKPYSFKYSDVTLSNNETEAYFINNSKILYFIDIKDSTKPSLIGTYDIEKYKSFALSGDFSVLFAIDNESQLKIINIADPKNPQLIGSYSSNVPMKYIALSKYGSKAYINTTKGLMVLDVSDRTHPTLIESYDIGSYGSFTLSDDETRILMLSGNNIKMLEYKDKKDKNTKLKQLFLGKTYYQVVDYYNTNRDSEEKYIEKLEFNKDGKTLTITAPNYNGEPLNEIFTYSIADNKLLIKGPISRPKGAIPYNLSFSSITSTDTQIKSIDGLLLYKTYQEAQNILDNYKTIEITKKIETKISRFVADNFSAKVINVTGDVDNSVIFTIEVMNYHNFDSEYDFRKFWYKYFSKSNAYYAMIKDAISNSPFYMKFAGEGTNLKIQTTNNMATKIPAIFNGNPYNMYIDYNMENRTKNGGIELTITLTPKNYKPSDLDKYFYSVGAMIHSMFSTKCELNDCSNTDIPVIRG